MSKDHWLFVDPGSKSTGWCLVRPGTSEIGGVGTIVAKEGKPAFDRLGEIARKYQELICDLGDEGLKVSDVLFECIPRTCAPEVPWSVGAIGAAISPFARVTVSTKMMPTAWQRTTGWKAPEMRKLKFVSGVVEGEHVKQGSPLLPYVEACDSKDALAAVGLALHWCSLLREGKVRM